MSTLTDDDLTRLLTEAADSWPVPDDGAPAVVGAAAQPAAAVPLRRRRPVQLLAAAAVVAAAFAGGALLQGQQNSVRATQQQAAPAAEPVEDAATAADGELLRQSGNLDYGKAEEASPAGAAAARETASLDALQPAAAPPAADAAAPPAVQAPAPDGARVVKTGSIALIVGDGRVTPTLTAVQEVATAAGGLVQSAQTQESGETPSGSVVLRVPVASFESVVSQVRNLDADVRTATTSGRDVTAEYTDLEAQLRTLQAARERFLEVLSGARTIGDILTVQQRVDEVTGQIDRLEGQRALLQSQSDSATLEVVVTEADDPVVAVTQKPDDGLAQAFRDAWDGFTSGVEAIVAASGRALLVLLSLAVVLLVARAGWRASRRRLV